MTPWWSEQAGALIGGIGGGVLGTIGGLYGSAMGVLMPRGKGKSIMLPIHFTLLGIGILGLLVGLIAVVIGQPYRVWYPLMLLGLILTCVLGGLLPVALRGYRVAEQRRMEAEALRKS